MKKILSRYKILLFILLLAFIIRVVKIGSYPIGLYSDEAAFGYNAKLLLETGRDEYNRFWPVSLESFGDWKPPMQAWLAIPFVWIMGLNEVAVRLPSAILGTATVAVVYFLARTLLRSDLSVRRGRTFSEQTALLASFFLAISPWHVFMSRIAMLVSIEVFFVSLGVLGLLKGRRTKYEGRRHFNWWWVLAAASFVGAVYSYYGSRVTVPLILTIFFLIYFNDIKSKLRQVFIPVMVAIILLSPILIQSVKESSVLTGRARTTSVFFNDNVRLQLWAAHTRAGLKYIHPLLSRFFDNKLYYYARDIAGRYASHFSPVFLFFKGDSHPPFKIPGLGYLNLVDFPFFLLGLFLIRGSLKQSKSNKSSLFLLLYLFVSPFVASLTFLTPAANRSFNLVIPWTLITAYGLTNFTTAISATHVIPAKAGIYLNRFLVKPRMTIAILFLYLISLSLFFYSYIYLIPRELPHHWHYGRKELVSKLKPLLSQYDKIYLTNKGGPPYIFLSFYLNIPPREFHETVIRNPIINELGWGHVDKILNFTIPREFSWSEVVKDKDALYIGFENEIPDDQVDILDRVYYPNGHPAYTIAVIK